jgi:uncharacterized protein (DUF2336 family)
MNPPLQAHGVDLQELLQLALDRSPTSRSTLAQVVADIGLAEDTGRSQREIQLAFDILHSLIHGVEMRVRRDLAQRLASRPDIPRDLIVTLANDQIDVAYPILVESVVLTDNDLIAIIRAKAAAHQIAVTLREKLNPAVTDALVDTRNVEVIDSLLRNPAAKLSETTKVRLVDMARDTPTLQRPLLQRADLNPELAWRMYNWVGEALKSYIDKKYSEGIDELDSEINAAVDKALARERAAAARNLPRLVEELERQGGISVETLTAALHDRDVDLFEALFARLAGIAPVAMPMIAYDPNGEMFAIACKACGFSEQNFETMYRLLTQALAGSPDEVTRDVGAVASYYRRLDSNAARKVLAEWRRTPAVAWRRSS